MGQLDLPLDLQGYVLRTSLTSLALHRRLALRVGHLLARVVSRADFAGSLGNFSRFAG
jgi:hypothetical protein